MADGHRKRTVQAIKRDLTAEYVRSILDYDPETGEFRWKVNRGKNHTISEIAGTTTKAGYRMISIWKVRYLAHRLAWLMVTNKWPKQQIDHMNHDRSDNRWENLREATPAQNQQNRQAKKPNVLFKGVHPDTRNPQRPWFAYITVNGQRHMLGYFATPEEAALAYNKAALHAFGEFAHLNTISVHSRN
jgi:hypothetical protein